MRLLVLLETGASYSLLFPDSEQSHFCEILTKSLEPAMTLPARTGPAAAHHRPVTPAGGTANHAPDSQSADSYLRPCGLRPGNRTAANPVLEKSADFGVDGPGSARQARNRRPRSATVLLWRRVSATSFRVTEGGCPGTFPKACEINERVKYSLRV